MSVFGAFDWNTPCGFFLPALRQLIFANRKRLFSRKATGRWFESSPGH
jgi:hypothetical protein